MVQLQPISTTATAGHSSDKQPPNDSSNSSNSSSPSYSSSSPNLPSPTSLLSPNFPMMIPMRPLLPHDIYRPLNPAAPPFDPHQLFYNFPFPSHHDHQQMPYFYYDFFFYPNLPPDHYIPHHQYHNLHHHDPHAYQFCDFYPQQAAPQVFSSFAASHSVVGGGGDGGVGETVHEEAAADGGGESRRGGLRRRVWKRIVSGPRNFHGRRFSFGRVRVRVRKLWNPRKSSSNSSAAPLLLPPSHQSLPPWTALGRNCNTLMIKNIPNDFSRLSLINLLETHCREQNEIAEHQTNSLLSEFDFLYLPFDFKHGRNLGYAFVNFTNVEGASRLYCCWNNVGWEGHRKIREIVRARLQGKERCKKHFAISVFRCPSEDYLPVILSPARNGRNSHCSRMIVIGTWQEFHPQGRRKP